MDWQHSKSMEIAERQDTLAHQNGDWWSQPRHDSHDWVEPDIENFIALRREAFYGPEKKTCQFCFSQVNLKKVVYCSENCSCFCRPCLEKFFQVGLKDFSSWNLEPEVTDKFGHVLPICPYSLGRGEESDGSRSAHVLLSSRQLQDKSTFRDCRQAFEKFSQIQSSRWLFREFGQLLLTCPRKSCLETMVLSCHLPVGQATDIRCPYCHFSFCSRCKEKEHQPFDCHNATFSGKVSRKIAEALIKLSIDFRFTDHHLLIPGAHDEIRQMDQVLTRFSAQVSEAITSGDETGSRSESVALVVTPDDDKATHAQRPY